MSLISGRRWRSLLTLAAATVALMLLASCSVGAYPVDYLQEMHYSPSIRRQEPPVMNAPADAVAFRGLGGPEAALTAPPAYDVMSTADLATIDENPLGDNESVRALGAKLFQRNCSVCHGALGDGAGSPVVVFQFEPAGLQPPADLTAAPSVVKPDGLLFAAITNGQGRVPAPADAINPAAYEELTNMPSFKKLLTVEERWAIVQHIRGLQGQ